MICLVDVDDNLSAVQCSALKVSNNGGIMGTRRIGRNVTPLQVLPTDWLTGLVSLQYEVPASDDVCPCNNGGVSCRVVFSMSLELLIFHQSWSLLLMLRMLLVFIQHLQGQRSHTINPLRQDKTHQ